MGTFYGISPQNGIAVGLGSIIALGVPATPAPPPPPTASYLLLEDNSFVLLEDSSKIELE